MRRWALLFTLLLLVAGWPAVRAQDPTPSAGEWLVTEWTFDIVEFERVDADATVRVHEATFRGRERTADGIRTIYNDPQRFGTTKEDVEREAEAMVRDRVTSSLEAIFPNATVENVTSDLDRTTMEDEDGTDAYHPSIDFAVTATIRISAQTFGLEAGEDTGLLEDALAMGATFEYGIEFRARPGRNNTFHVEFPEDVDVVSAAGGATVQGDTVTRVVRNWKGTTTVKPVVPVEIQGENAQRYDARRGGVVVRIDLDRVEVRSLTEGKADVTVNVTVAAELAAVEVPADVRDGLPSQVSITHVGADGLRLALQRGYADESAIDEALGTFDSQVTESLRSLLGPDVDPRTRLDRASVEAPVDTSEMDAEPPIRAVASAEGRMPVGGFGGQAAIVLYSSETSFQIRGFPGWNTTYTIVLPPGLALTKASLDGEDRATLTRSEEGGRASLRADMPSTESGSDAQLTMGIGITPTFLLGQFPLLALLSVLSVVGVVAWAALRFVRRHKRTGR